MKIFFSRLKKPVLGLLFKFAISLICFLSISSTVFGNEFVWGVFPCEQNAFYITKNNTNTPYFSGVGKMYISVNSKKGEFAGLKYHDPDKKNVKLDFVFSDFVITEYQDDKNGTCKFQGYETFEKRPIKGVIKYTGPMSIVDFRMDEFSRINPGLLFNQYFMLNSKVGKEFKEKYFEYINIESN